MTAPRVLAVCADDFGLTPGISAGIARLAHTGRLTAISCLTNGADWASAAPLLDGLPTSVDVGLHLNFTEGRPLSPRLAKRWPQFPALAQLIALAALLFSFYIVAEYFVLGNNVPGWATLATGLAFSIGVQLLSVGILGEYIGRIFDEVKQRPVYLIGQALGQGAIEGEGRADVRGDG